MDAPTINTTYQSVHTVCIASRRRVCLQLTSRIVQSTQSRRWRTLHPTIRRKVSTSLKLLQKTSPVPFMLYADIEASLVPSEENIESASNTKVRQLHKPSGFACLRFSLVPEFNGEIFTHSGEDSMTIFFENIRDQTTTSEASYRM